MDREDDRGQHVDLDALLQHALTATPESEQRIVANALAADRRVVGSSAKVAGDSMADADVDALLQAVLAATPEVENRVVATALAADRVATPSFSMLLGSRPAMAGAGALLLALVAAGWLVLRPQAPAPQRLEASRPAQSAIVTTDGRVTVIQKPGEPLTLIGPGPGPLKVPVGTGSIVLLGESR